MLNYLYNLLFDRRTNNTTSNYPKLDIEDIYNYNDIDDKEFKKESFIFIRNYKNIYYKYTNKDKFNVGLYNNYINSTEFDSDMTALDDDDPIIRIIDKYIIEYIKIRNEFITYIICKNKKINFADTINNIKNYNKNDEEIDIVFVIDLKDKECFDYCFTNCKNKNMTNIKDILFSIIIKHNNEFIRIKLKSITSKPNYQHPYLILEKLL